MILPDWLVVLVLVSSLAVLASLVVALFLAIVSLLIVGAVVFLLSSWLLSSCVSSGVILLVMTIDDQVDFLLDDFLHCSHSEDILVI